jgi:hypothetical protein|nr:MAG TPA: Protein of unknown function (DUF2634) [Caudoviricetes sp.]
MAVLPAGRISGSVEYVSQPSKTWRIDPPTHRLSGTCEGYDAVRQAVNIILNVERYRWQIFQSSSGMEWEGLLGQDAGFVAAELQRRATEALMMDDRVTGIENFDYNVRGQTLSASFTVTTIYGGVEAGMEVNIA